MDTTEMDYDSARRVRRCFWVFIGDNAKEWVWFFFWNRRASNCLGYIDIRSVRALKSARM
jgi:hypothetical protein